MKLTNIEDAPFFGGDDCSEGAGAGFISTDPEGGEDDSPVAGAGEGGTSADGGGGGDAVVSFEGGGAAIVSLEGGGAATVPLGAGASLLLSAITTTMIFSFLRQLSLTPLMK